MTQMTLGEKPAAADSVVFEQLRRRLDRNLHEPGGTRHVLYLATGDDAAAVAQVLEREGWDTAVQEDEDAWVVVARSLRVLTEPLGREIRAHLAALAIAHGGAYDGWEAAPT